MYKIIILSYCFVAILTMSGCADFRNKISADKKKKEEISALKKKNYETLIKSLANNSLLKGAQTEKVKEMFGEPDDILLSGSAVGKFEVWTYEKVQEKNYTPDRQPIRLYFDGNKLINWEY